MLGLQSSIASVFQSFRVWLSARGSSPTTSPFSLLAAAATELPEGISLQMMDQNHDLFQVKNLLVKAFVSNNQPVVQTLGELYYPLLPIAERIPMVERRFGKFFSEESLRAKVKQGLSVVAVKDNDPSQVVSVLFGEKYGDGIYKSCSSIDDRLCQAALNLMYAVHEKALPALEGIDGFGDIIFVSHGATHPKYQSLGIMQQICKMGFVLARKKGVKVAYFITTGERFSKFLISGCGAQVVAEVLYEDYQVNGKRVFAKIAQKEVSAKALICVL